MPVLARGEPGETPRYSGSECERTAQLPCPAIYNCRARTWATLLRLDEWSAIAFGVGSSGGGVRAELGLRRTHCAGATRGFGRGADEAQGEQAPKKPNLPCSKEMTRVSGFCIDRWEAHTVLADNPSKRRSPYETLRDGEELIAKSAPGVTRQGYINRIEASAACVAAGKRLCSAKEWYRACAGAIPTQGRRKSATLATLAKAMS